MNHEIKQIRSSDLFSWIFLTVPDYSRKKYSIKKFKICASDKNISFLLGDYCSWLWLVVKTTATTTWKLDSYCLPIIAVMLKLQMALKFGVVTLKLLWEMKLAEYF